MGSWSKVADMKTFLLFTKLSLLWSIPVPQGFSHSSDVHHVSVSFGNSQAPRLSVPLSHHPMQPTYTLQAVHPIQAPVQVHPPFHTLTVHSPPLRHQVPHHPLAHHQVGHHPAVHHQVGHHPQPLVHHHLQADHQLVAKNLLAAVHYRLSPDRPAARAPAFFSSELLPVRVGELVPGSLEVARGPKQLNIEEAEESESDEDKVASKADVVKGGVNEGEKKKEEGTEKLGRTPRLLVIGDVEEEGSNDGDDFEEEGSSDDEELDDILEDFLKATQEEIPFEELKNETSEEFSDLSPEKNSTEIESEEEIPEENPSKEPLSPPNNEIGEKDTEELKDSAKSIDIKIDNDSNEEEKSTSLKGIKTILFVTTNPDKNDAKLTEKIFEAKVDPKEFLENKE